MNMQNIAIVIGLGLIIFALLPMLNDFRLNLKRTLTKKTINVEPEMVDVGKTQVVFEFPDRKYSFSITGYLVKEFDYFVVDSDVRANQYIRSIGNFLNTEDGWIPISSIKSITTERSKYEIENK